MFVLLQRYLQTQVWFEFDFKPVFYTCWVWLSKILPQPYLFAFHCENSETRELADLVTEILVRQHRDPSY